MDQWIKVFDEQAWQAEFNPWDLSRDFNYKLSSDLHIYALAQACVSACTCAWAHTHAKYINKKYNFVFFLVPPTALGLNRNQTEVKPGK